jgi:hypothetical protein
MVVSGLLLSFPSSQNDKALTFRAREIKNSHFKRIGCAITFPKEGIPSRIPVSPG